MPDDVLDLHYVGPPPPPNLARRAKAQARRRRRVQIAVATVSLTAGTAVAVPLAVHSSSDHVQQRLASNPTAPAAPAARPTKSVPMHRAAAGALAGPTGVVPGLGTGAPLPSRFIAFTPGGAERPTLVDTSSGATIRVLGPGAQVGGVLSADRATLYLPLTSQGLSVGTCGEDWQAIAVATGQAVAAPGLNGLGFAVSPDGNQVAFVTMRDGCSDPGNGGAEVLGVRNLDGSGNRTVPMPAGNWNVDAWGPGGALLLRDLSDARVAVYDAGSLARTAVLPALPHGCVQGAATLRSAHDVVLAETCYTTGHAGHADLVDLDPTTGHELRRVVIASGTDAQWIAPIYNNVSLDPSGQHALVTIDDMNQDRQGEVYIITGSTSTRQGLDQVYGALW